jgi:hypothetical protein
MIHLRYIKVYKESVIMNNKSTTKATNPLLITCFNKQMCCTSLNFLIAFVMLQFYVNIPSWLIIALNISIWINLICGIIITIGFAIAVTDRNVYIYQHDLENKKEK